MWRKTVKSLQEYVSSLFYTHGLFCASHPVAIISLVITVALITCYPLTNLPLPGNAPQQLTTPLQGYKIPPTVAPTAAKETDTVDEDDVVRPRWYVGAPVAYVQQIVVRAVVSPWQPQMLIQTDAFRAPLSKAFDVLEQINQFNHVEGVHSVSLSDVCLHVSETRGHKKVKGLVPEYSCLVVSPANFWGKDRARFSSDSEIVKTIYKKYGPTVNAPPTIQDILFGVPLRDIGVKKYFLRNRQRVISFAVTMVFEKYNPLFVEALETKLRDAFPDAVHVNQSHVDHLVHVHYKDMNYFVEYTPLLVTYMLLFLYIYFSVSKFEMVKSKWGLALSAVVTVIASLLMSVSMCMVFGLTPSLNGSEIFPYLVVIVGLENVLVVTKSVVSTPVHLDVKLRVAQGLRKEGWYIFKNLMLEMLILAVGFFTFVPAIQEFCLFAVVGLLSDFFLQMFFFVTVLSVDIRRMELSDLHRQSVQRALHKPAATPRYRNLPTNATDRPVPLTGHILRSKSAPGLEIPPDSSIYEYGALPTPPPSPKSAGSLQDDAFFPQKIWRTPRRVKFMNVWARTRVVQRGLMTCVVIWISLIVYKTGLVEFVAQHSLATVTSSLGMAYPSSDTSPTPNQRQPPATELHNPVDPGGGGRVDSEKTATLWNTNGDPAYSAESTAHDDENLARLFGPVNMETWRNLHHMHWPTLLGYYNISIHGRYITILPSIHLHLVVTPNIAVAMRHPEEHAAISHMGTAKKDEESPPEDSLIPEEETVEDSTEEIYKMWGSTKWKKGELPHLDLYIAINKLVRAPRTRQEWIATVLLLVASIILLVYLIIATYRCMCSRNYAKWSSSWSKTRRNRLKASPYFKQIRESVPLLLQGHEQEVECVVTDGPFVVTSCLGGQLRLWDSFSGECVTTIRRGGLSPSGSASHQSNGEGGMADEMFATESLEKNGDDRGQESCHSVRQRHNSRSHSRHRSMDFTEVMPDLSTTIDTDFKGMENEKAKPRPPLQPAPPCGQPQPPSRPSHHRRNYSADFTAMNNFTAPIPPAPPANIAISPGGNSHHKHRRNLSADFRYSSPVAHPTVTNSYPQIKSLENQRAGLPGSCDSFEFCPGADLSPGVDWSLSEGEFSMSSLDGLSPSSSTNLESCPSSLSSHRASWSAGCEISQPVLNGLDIPAQPASNGHTPSLPSGLDIPAGNTKANGIHHGFDFSKFAPLYEEHKQTIAEKAEYLRERRRRLASQEQRLSQSPKDSVSSAGDCCSPPCSSSLGAHPERRSSFLLGAEDIPSPVWSLACQNNLIVAGCADGRIEFWDGMSGRRKHVYHESEVGVTAICYTESRVIAARLNGLVDFLEVRSYVDMQPSPLNLAASPTPAQYSKSYPQRSQSIATITADMKLWDECIQVTLVGTTRAHQQPINALQAEARRAVTGSQDHTLKVFRLDDSICLYTLHGHNGGITALYLDKMAPLAAASGSEDGTVRLWDLITGNCVHKLEGHDGTVTSLTCTPMYVVSTGMDDRLCIWERCKGHLLHWIQMEPGYCNSVAMLTSNLMVTGGQGCIYLWDVSKGHALRAVQLGDDDHSIFVRQLRVINHATVVCDYGNQLRVIHFPAVLEKAD